MRTCIGARSSREEGMGHSSITTTALYLHVTRKTLDKTQNPLDLLDLSQLPHFAEVPPCQPS